MGEGVPDERLSSRDLRVFDGVEVGRHRFLPGETAFPSLPGHLVNLHVGAPTGVVTRRDDGAWEGMQTDGNVEVLSAGKGTEQVLRGASEDVSVMLGEGFFRRIIAEMGLDPDSVEVLDSFESRDPTVERILLALVPELEGKGLGGDLYVESLATALAVHLVRQHSSLGDARRASRETGGRLSRRTLRLVEEYVDGNLDGDLSLGGLSAVANLSSRHFLRLFKGSTGLSPHQYVVRARVRKARALLVGGDLSLGQVAKECGFAHQQHLSRCFKRLVGTSPGRYRERLRG